MLGISGQASVGPGRAGVRAEHQNQACHADAAIPGSEQQHRPGGRLEHVVLSSSSEDQRSG